MKVVEIFRSIQGEGRTAGWPTVFVRLGVCNLNCVWCDTPYAHNGGEEMPLDRVIATVEALGPGQVCVTGGEPLLQPEGTALARHLAESGRHVTFMTNGSLPIGPVRDTTDPRHQRIDFLIDVKSPWHDGPAPDSMAGLLPTTTHFHYENIANLRTIDEVKFIVRNRIEFDWAVGFANLHSLWGLAHAVRIGPVSGEIGADTIADWILESRTPAVLHVQLHKILWGVDTRR